MQYFLNEYQIKIAFSFSFFAKNDSFLDSTFDTFTLFCCGMFKQTWSGPDLSIRGNKEVRNKTKSVDYFHSSVHLHPWVTMLTKVFVDLVELEQRGYRLGFCSSADLWRSTIKSESSLIGSFISKTEMAVFGFWMVCVEYRTEVSRLLRSVGRRPPTFFFLL